MQIDLARPDLPAAPELLILCLLPCAVPPELLLPGGLLAAFSAPAVGVALLVTACAEAAPPMDGRVVASAAAGGCSAGGCVSEDTSGIGGRTGTGWKYVLLSFTSNPAYTQRTAGEECV